MKEDEEPSACDYGQKRHDMEMTELRTEKDENLISNLGPLQKDIS
jgi:hypothetical protein